MPSFPSALLRRGTPPCCGYFGVSAQGHAGDELPEAKPHGRNELTEYRDQLREHPEMRMLFSTVGNTTKEDAETVFRTELTFLLVK